MCAPLPPRSAMADMVAVATGAAVPVVPAAGRRHYLEGFSPRVLALLVLVFGAETEDGDGPVRRAGGARVRELRGLAGL